MSFILVSKRGEDVHVNGWSWRPTLELLRNEELISQENYERMGAQGAGGQVDSELADRVADVVEHFLMAMKPGERMLADLTVTTRPKVKLVLTANTEPNDIDAVDIYSATYEWLAEFVDFCRRSGGFEVL